MTQTFVVQTRGLTRAYGDRVALDGLDLDVGPGECVALLGHNGSGKTTALRSIAGQLKPTSGMVRVDGADPHREPEGAEARKALGFVPDTPLFYRDLTVREHVELVALTHGVADDEWEQRVDDLLAAVGIDHRAGSFPQDLSSGMRQRAQLACVLVRPLRVLLLDEPVLRLDPGGQRMLRRHLDDLVGRNVALIVATHQPDFMIGLATRGLVLEEGRVAADGPYDEVIVSHAAVRLGLTAATGEPRDEAPDDEA